MNVSQAPNDPSGPSRRPSLDQASGNPESRSGEGAEERLSRNSIDERERISLYVKL